MAGSVSEADRPFDPQRLTPEASLQRVVIAALRGVPPDVAGRPSSEPCSRDALAGLVLDAGGLPAPQPERLGDQLAELRSSVDPTTRALAGQVLRAYGARLGALLATLKHPATPKEQGNTQGRLAYLENWLDVERVWLGGGLLVPGGAADIVEGAEQVLALSGTDLDLRVAASPTVLALVGAARSVEPRDGCAVVADAGHSTIKTAVAIIEGGTLAALETLPPRTAPRRDSLRAVESGLVAALVAAVQASAAGSGRHTRIAVSVASYLDGDAPVRDGRSMYAGLAPQRVGHLVATSTGNDISIEFLHDGSASALGTADPGVSAVITVGTWLGIGFTPATRPLLRGDPVIRPRQVHQSGLM